MVRTEFCKRNLLFHQKFPHPVPVMVNGIKNELLGSGATAIEYLTNTKAIRGKENWLFYNAVSEDEESMRDFLCNNLYEENELSEISKRYVLLEQKLKEMGIELGLQRLNLHLPLFLLHGGILFHQALDPASHPVELSYQQPNLIPALPAL